MSLSSLPVELLTSIAQELEDHKSLTQFTLVSTFFRAASRRLLWRRVHLQCLDGMYDETELVLFIGTNRELAEGIADLRITYSTSSYTEHVIIKAKDLLNLPTSFPNLTSLSIDDARHIDISPPLPNSNIFSFLTHIDFDTRYDIDFTLLEQLLSISPNVIKLNLTERTEADEDDYYRTIPNCPILKHLKITTIYLHEVFYSEGPLIAFSCLAQLESLYIFQYKVREDLDKLLNYCSSTLKSFSYILDSFDSVEYELIRKVFPKLKQLEVLEMPTLINVPQDFLQLIPSTMKIIRVSLKRSQLEYLRDNPRPELRLIEINIESGNWYGWQLSSDDRREQKWKLIPPSVEVIRVDYQIRYCSTLDLFALLLANRKGGMLKRVSIDLVDDELMYSRNFDRKPKALFELFKEINIHLEFREEGR